MFSGRVSNLGLTEYVACVLTTTGRQCSVPELLIITPSQSFSQSFLLLFLLASYRDFHIYNLFYTKVILYSFLFCNWKSLDTS